jgi:predicted  nucleic acid-binding Zn-ribbon protein
MNKIPKFKVFESTEDFNAGEKMQQLKRREIQNKERYKAAQERGDNYAIKYYEFRMRLDKLDGEKAKIRKEIQALKKKFGKFKK